MKALATLALFVSVACAFSQESNWSLGAYYSFGQRDYAAVTSNQIRQIDDLFGAKWADVGINAFAGVSAKGNTLVGFSGTLSYRAADGLHLFLGLGVDGNVTELANLSLGVHGGIRYAWRF